MIRIDDHVDLTTLNTFGVTGTARRLVTYSTPDDLDFLFSPDNNSWKIGRVIHIGGGSNLLFVGDFNGTILKSGITAGPLIEPQKDATVLVTAASGTEMDDLCADMASRGFWGIENLSGIPGTVGAAAVQNIGAYGVEIADSIVEVHLFDTISRSHIVMSPDQCDYGYRHSLFKKEGIKGRYIITAVTLRLSSCCQPKLSYGHLASRLESLGRDITPAHVRQEVIAMRDSKLPDWHRHGNAGSYFKNVETTPSILASISAAAGGALVPHYPLPDGRVKIPSAWLIEQCGWKGRSIGGAQVWQKQPLVLVNASGSATAADIITLERQIVDSVRHKFGVTIEPEVEKIMDL